MESGGLVRAIVGRGEAAVERTLARLHARRALSRGTTFLRAGSTVAGTRCHCPALPVHFVHSEGIREACDFVIDFDSNVESPDRPQIPVALLPDAAATLRAGATVHVKTDLLEDFTRLVLPRVRAPIVLVTGDSDAGYVERFEHLLHDARIAHWFAQNCDVAYDHPRLTRLPIGVDNPVFTKIHKRLGFALAMLIGRIPFDASCSRNRIGDQVRLGQVAAAMTTRVRDKPPRALCTFHNNGLLVANAHTIPDRREALDVLRASPDCDFTERRLPADACWRLHDRYAFEVSPRGVGLDCFRTWECLLLETIPIVKTSVLDALYRQEGFPVVIVESFREITAGNLARWKRERQDAFTDDLRRRLTNDYWVGLIRAAAGRARDVTARSEAAVGADGNPSCRTSRNSAS